MYIFIFAGWYIYLLYIDVGLDGLKESKALPYADIYIVLRNLPFAEISGGPDYRGHSAEIPLKGE